MAHDQGGSDDAGMKPGDKARMSETRKADGKNEASQAQEQTQGGRRHGEQASQIAGSQGQRNEQSRHQDQAAQTSREQK